MKLGYIYILTNPHHTVLYTGVTSDLPKRIYQHKHHLADGFTKQYNINKLVYYEECGEIIDAIQREKVIKKWHREWKIKLINQLNPGWMDLYEEICG